MTQGHAVIRCDASLTIGVGHLVRCGVLADALEAQGWTCSFAVRSETAAFAEGLRYFSRPVVVVDSLPEEEPEWLAGHFAGGVALLVVDHYGWSDSLEMRCRPWARCVLSIDDRAAARRAGDFLLDQTLGRSPEDYRALVPPSCRVLAGADYALVRDMFARAREGALTRRAAGGAARQILVNLGGGDHGPLVAEILDALKAVSYSGMVDIVVGTMDLQEEDALAKRFPFELRVHRNVSTVVDLMVAADIGIGGCGSSVYERLCLGLPSLALIVADNQRDQGLDLARKGLAVVAAAKSVTLAEDLRKGLGILFDDAIRKDMAVRAAASCDAAGAYRALAQISRGN